MDQRSKNKVKLFRTLKVVFYCLGLPLFALAVVLTAATEYVGEFAYAGLADTELFASMKVLFNGTALYGVWVAAGVWLLIAVVHIILAKTVKNRRARTLIVGVVALIAMLAPVVVMDLVIPVQLDKIASEAPEGVTIASYDEEVGHFYTRTSASWTKSGKYESNNYLFVNSVENFLRTYNIGIGGGNKSGTANNTANTPVRYGELFKDGVGRPFADDERATDLVQVEANGDGLLEVDGIVFEDYYLGTSNGLWYRTSAMAEMKDGVYGYAGYNSNGMLADGYVYGIDVAIEILEDYYYAQELMTKISNQAAVSYVTLPTDAEIRQQASAAREKEYLADENSYEYYLYTEKVVAQEGDFSLTREELDNVLNALGGAIGGTLGDALRYILKENGGSLIGGLIPGDKTENGMIINIYEKDEAGNDTEVVSVSIGIEIGDHFGNGTEVLTVTLGGKTFGGETFEIGLDSRLIPALAKLLDWVMTLDAVKGLGYTSAADLIADVINGGSANETISTIGTVVGLLGGLIGLDSVLDLIPTDAASTEDMLYGLIENLLGGLYWYQSPEVKPLYDYYVSGLGEGASDLAKEYAEALAMYDRAVYEGGQHGYMIGSVLVPGSSIIAGDTLGNGSYSAAVPTSYAELMQFKTELSYKTWLYPLLGVRECLVCFVPFVVLFLILSGVAAEKEMLYATGQESAKKSKKDKDDKAEDASSDSMNNDADVSGAASGAYEEPAPENVTPAVAEEGSETIVSENNDKEVL